MGNNTATNLVVLVTVVGGVADAIKSTTCAAAVANAAATADLLHGNDQQWGSYSHATTTTRFQQQLEWVWGLFQPVSW